MQRRMNTVLASAALLSLGMAGAQLVPADEDEIEPEDEPEPEPQLSPEPPQKLTRQQRRHRERMAAKAKR